MLGEIRALPAEVVNLIAAGEVIDSLAAVVRELVENALDAEADRINICLVPELWQVRVTDNGTGMSLADLKACVRPHSTSKIRSCRDLWQISSLGFRGEALHSIAQVADLKISSRRSGTESIGWRVNYRQGELDKEEVVAIAPGTTVTVSNLFGNIPVRRRGLPPFPQQLKAIQKIIYQIALCHPQVTWQAKLEQKNWFSLSPGKNAKDILPQILKRINRGDLHYLKLEIPTPANQSEDWEEKATGRLGEWATEKTVKTQSPVELVIGLPDRCHRHRADWVKVAVNRRFVRSPELEQTMLNGMAKTLPRNRYPVCLLHLQTCPSQVDWNRHPAKTEIYLSSLAYWQEQISRAIEEALKFDTDKLPARVGDRRIGKILQAAEASGKYHVDENLNPPLIRQPRPKIGSLTLKAVAQVNKTYIVAEHPAGVWLIEQHIAHERVLYERLQDDWQLVPLETPLVLPNLILRQIEQLERLGIAIEPFGEKLWAVRNIPQMLAQREDLADALLELSWGGDLRTAQVATACRSAIRNGTPLTMEEMQNLLDRWQATRNPRTCPHGRPIYLSLDETELSRFFRRHWVIGKSHGI